jgi:DNA (cytosine-5)-methyltransferase 1
MHTITRTSWERLTSRYLSQPHEDDPISAAKAAVLTPHQLSRIQGFPVDWNWSAGTKQDIMQMIANAVPPPVARSIGSVILARQQGITIPENESSFLDWLERGDRTRATARNVKARVGRARRLLGGRTFSDIALEIGALKAIPEFAALHKGTRSDLRQALILHADFLASKNSKSKKPKTIKPSINLDESDAQNDGSVNAINEPEFARAS